MPSEAKNFFVIILFNNLFMCSVFVYLSRFKKINMYIYLFILSVIVVCNVFVYLSVGNEINMN